MGNIGNIGEYKVSVPPPGGSTEWAPGIAPPGWISTPGIAPPGPGQQVYRNPTYNT